MPQYKVTEYLTLATTLTIEADSKEDAVELARSDYADAFTKAEADQWNISKVRYVASRNRKKPQTATDTVDLHSILNGSQKGTTDGE